MARGRAAVGADFPGLGVNFHLAAVKGLVAAELDGDGFGLEIEHGVAVVGCFATFSGLANAGGDDLIKPVAVKRVVAKEVPVDVAREKQRIWGGPC